MTTAKCSLFRSTSRKTSNGTLRQELSRKAQHWAVASCTIGRSSMGRSNPDGINRINQAFRSGETRMIQSRFKSSEITEALWGKCIAATDHKLKTRPVSFYNDKQPLRGGRLLAVREVYNFDHASPSWANSSPPQRSRTVRIRT